MCSTDMCVDWRFVCVCSTDLCGGWNVCMCVSPTCAVDVEFYVFHRPVRSLTFCMCVSPTCAVVDVLCVSPTCAVVDVLCVFHRPVWSLMNFVLPGCLASAPSGKSIPEPFFPPNIHDINIIVFIVLLFNQ